jgi:hypothetical protein
MPRKITAADVCEVSGYSRSELRSVLSALPYYSQQKSYPRKARHFTRQDLTAICLVQELEAQFGMRREAIATVFDAMHSILSGPRNQNRRACLLISLSPPAAKYEEGPVAISSGICVALSSVFERVDQHFGSFGAPVPEQRDLALHPALIGGRERAKTS